MENVVYFIGTITLSYLVGSFPSGLIIGKLYGLDVRMQGSGRTGATNILRTLGWKAALVVTSLDLLKSSLVILAYGYFLDPIWQSIASAGILLGHSWSAFAGLKGGRGVVPAVGIAIVVSPLSAIIGVSIGIVIIAITRYVSLGSLIGTVTACSIVLAGTVLVSQPAPYGILAIYVGSWIVFTHKDNIGRLINGEERKLGKVAE